MSQPAHPVDANDLSWTPGGTRVVGPLDLSISCGELVVIIGPNGAGKTSLIRLLAGLTAPTHGEVRWFGRDAVNVDRRSRARQLVYLPQLSPLSIPLTVEDFVRLGRYPHRNRWTLAAGPDDAAAVASAIDRLELGPLLHRPMVELSGGERQRVSLAASLAQGGSVWLLDEPTTYLDPRHQVEVLELLQQVHSEGRTLVVTTHDLNLAARLATRVVALTDGRVAADGTPDEILSPQSLRQLFEAEFEVEEHHEGVRIWLAGSSSTGTSTTQPKG